MYQSLVKIGLKKYLNEYFFNKEWLSEEYLEKLNSFVALKSKEQQAILKNKFTKKLSHLSANDHLHELLIACAFHPNGLFQKEIPDTSSSDIIDNGILVEIKTINASPDEIERIKALVPNSVRNSLPKDNEYEARICQKFKQRIEKAREQVKDNGIVYIVWDSTFVINFRSRKTQIERLFERLILTEKKKSPNLKIQIVYFEDLREKVAKTHLS